MDFNRIFLKHEIELYQQELINLRQYKDVLRKNIQDLKSNKEKLAQNPDSLIQCIESIDKTVECFDKRLNKTEVAFFNMHKMVAKIQEQQEINKNKSVCKNNELTLDTCINTSGPVINSIKSWEQNQQKAEVNQTSILNRSEPTSTSSNRFVCDTTTSTQDINTFELRKVNANSHFKTNTVNGKLSNECLVDKLSKLLCENGIPKKYFIRKLFGTDANHKGKERFKKIREFINNPNEVESFLRQAKIDTSQQTRYRSGFIRKRSDSNDSYVPSGQRSSKRQNYEYVTSEEEEEIDEEKIKQNFSTSSKTQFEIPKHKENVLNKYFVYNRYPDQRYHANYPFHQNQNGFDYLSKLLDLHIGVIKQWFDLKILKNPLVKYQDHYNHIFRLFLSEAGSHELQLYARRIDEPVGKLYRWFSTRRIAARELSDAIKFYSRQYGAKKQVDSPSCWNLTSDDCDEEDIHVINHDDIECIDERIVQSYSNDSVIVIDELSFYH